MSFEDIKARLDDCNQSQLLKFWDQLDNDEREGLLKYLGDVPFKFYNDLFKRAIEALTEDVEKLDARMKPIPNEQFESEVTCGSEKLEEYRNLGLEAIADGRVGVILMAGGQGTRLGVDYPKGMYSVGLPSGKTLFQIQAERIRKIQQLAEEAHERRGIIPWYIMVSGPTAKPTREFLEKNNYFGLSPENVVLFEQSLLPCFDFKGKIILEDKNKIVFAPDGNGGIYGSLEKNGVLDDMERRGVRYLHVHSIDNILVKVADPVFIGYCIKKKADCGAKVVQKNGPFEAVGVISQVDGHVQVVEYSEITEQTATLTDSEGNLVFRAGNICNHFFTTEFLCNIADNYEGQLKLHVAKKKINYINDEGVLVKPKTPNGIKIEKFIFDVFSFSKNFVMWEVPRYSEFSALKNSDDVGKDCPSTAKRDLLSLHKKYLQDAGATVVGEEVEISPLLSYAGENLKDRVKNKTLNSPMELVSD